MLAALRSTAFRQSLLYLALSETMGDLEVLEDEGAVARSEADRPLRFELV